MSRTTISAAAGIFAVVCAIFMGTVCHANTTRVNWHWTPTDEDYIEAAPGVQILEEYVFWLSDLEKQSYNLDYKNDATRRLDEFRTRWAKFGNVDVSRVRSDLDVNLWNRTDEQRLDLFEKAVYIYSRSIRSLRIYLAFDSIFANRDLAFQYRGYYFATARFHEYAMKQGILCPQNNCKDLFVVMADFISLKAKEYHFLEASLQGHPRLVEREQIDANEMEKRFAFFASAVANTLFHITNPFPKPDTPERDRLINGFIEAVSEGPTTLREDFGGYLRIFKIFTRFSDIGGDDVLRMASALKDAITDARYSETTRKKDLMMLFELLVFPRTENIQPALLPLVHEIIASGLIDREIIQYLDAPSWWTLPLETYEQIVTYELGFEWPESFVRTGQASDMSKYRFDILYGTANPAAAAETALRWKRAVAAGPSTANIQMKLQILNDCEAKLEP